MQTVCSTRGALFAVDSRLWVIFRFDNSCPPPPMQMIRPLPAACSDAEGSLHVLSFDCICSPTGQCLTCCFQSLRVCGVSFLSFRPHALFLAPHLRPVLQPSVSHPNKVTVLTLTPRLPAGKRVHRAKLAACWLRSCFVTFSFNQATSE